MSTFKHDGQPLYATNDLNLAAALKNSGMPLLRIENNSGRGRFVFEDSLKLKETISRYFNDTLHAPAFTLFQTWRSLKALTFAAIGDVR